MKKLLLFLTLCVLLFSCEKPSQDSLDVEVGEISYSLTSDYHLCSNLYDAYFDFFNNHMDAGYLETQVTAICHDFGFDIDYYADLQFRKDTRAVIEKYKRTEKYKSK